MKTRKSNWQLACDAIQNESFTEIKKLIEEDSSLLLIKDENGNSLLHIAAKKQRPRLLSIITHLYAKYNHHSFITLPNSEGDTPLHLSNSAVYILLNHLTPDIQKWKTYVKDNHTKMIITYPMAAYAIACHFIPAIKRFLAESPDLLREKNNYGDTLLHTAAIHSKDDCDMMKVIIEYAGEHAKKYLQSINHHHDTALHISAKQSAYSVTKFILDTLGHTANLTARQMNLSGKIPLTLLVMNPHQDRNYTKLLEDITLSFSVRPLSKKISIENTQLKYIEPIKKNRDLLQYFEIACKAVNHTKQIIRKSNTHPEVNAWDTTTLSILKSKIVALRNAFDKAVLQSKKEGVTDENSLQRLSLRTQLTREYRIGNCREFTDMSAHYIRLAHPTVRIEAFEIENSDHCFTVINRPELSFAHDYTTWDDTIICDAWAGKVFLASEIPIYLSYYLYYSRKNDSTVNITGPFNPHYHSLERLFQVDTRDTKSLTAITKIKTSFFEQQKNLCSIKRNEQDTSENQAKEKKESVEKSRTTYLSYNTKLSGNIIFFPKATTTPKTPCSSPRASTTKHGLLY